MNVVIIILVIGALIQSFIHCTQGTIHDFDRLFGGAYSTTFIILTIFSIIKYGVKCLWIMPLVFFISNLLFTIIFDKLFKLLMSTNRITNIQKITIKDLLKNIMINLASHKYTYKIVNDSYSYSSEITDIFKILNDDNLKKIYDENISNYSNKEKKELDKKDPLTFTLVECIIYINWLWYIENSGQAVGIILKRIEDNRYLYALKRLYDLID